MDVLRCLPSELRWRVVLFLLRCPHRPQELRDRARLLRWYCRLCGEPCYDRCMYITAMQAEDTGTFGGAEPPPNVPAGWACPWCYRSRCAQRRTGMCVACARCILNGFCTCDEQ